MSYQGSETNGVWRGLSQPVNLRIEEYDGNATEGELVVNTRPGIDQYRIFVGTESGNLVPVRYGSQSDDAEFSMLADTINIGTVNNVSDAGNVGLIAITGGAGGNGITGSGEGGDIALIAGRSGNTVRGTAAEGGSIQLTTGAGGDGGVGGAAGSIELITHNGGDGSSSSGGPGGNLNITLGDGGDSAPGSEIAGGVGGSLTINAGDGGAGTETGAGGGICLIGGLGHQGGLITLRAGRGLTQGGDIEITAGEGPDQRSGSIILTIAGGTDQNGGCRLQGDIDYQGDPIARLHLPSARDHGVSLTGSVCTVQTWSPPTASQISQLIYRSTNQQVCSAKLTITVAHYTHDQHTTTEIMEYLVARSADAVYQERTGYLSTDPAQYESKVSITVTDGGTMSVFVNPQSGHRVRINTQVTEFMFGTI